MKDILVHVDGSERCRARIELAIGLAQRFDARLTGLFAQADSHVPSAVARRPSENLRRAAEEAHALFGDMAAAAGIRIRWWQLAHGEPGHVVSETGFCARYADLVVLGQHEPKGPVPEELNEHVLLNGGRPILVVPHSGSFAQVGSRVTIAWNAGREAARALHDALPLMAGAKAVTVLWMRGGPGGGATAEDMPQVDVIDHLAENGLQATGERLAAEDIGKMDMLLSRICDLGTDLLVMGGHGNYGMGRLRGSGTKYVLKHMTIPVLMSN